MKNNMIRATFIFGFLAASTAAYMALARTRELESQIAALRDSQFNASSERHDSTVRELDRMPSEPRPESASLQKAAREHLDNPNQSSGCDCSEDRVAEVVLRRIESNEFAMRAARIARSNAPFIVAGSLQDLQEVVADLLSRIHDLKQEYGEDLSPLEWEALSFEYEAKRLARIALPRLEQLCGDNYLSVYSRVVGYQSLVKPAEEARGTADSR